MGLKTTRNSKGLSTNQEHTIKSKDVVKVVDNADSKKIKSDINKFSDKILKTTDLGNKYQEEIGSNTLKSTYNGVINTKKGNETTTKTIYNNKGLSTNQEQTIKSKDVVKVVDNADSKNIKSYINKFSDEILKTTNLDNNYQEEIGSNTLKSTYNGVINTKKGVETTTKTIQTIKRAPHNYEKIKYNVRKIPKIKTGIQFDNIKGTLKGIKITRIEGFKGVPKIIRGTNKIQKKVALKGFKNIRNKFKNIATNKTDETSDIGANTLFSTIAGVKGTIKSGRKLRCSYNKINTVLRKSLKGTNIGTIKTKIQRNKISDKVKSHFSKFTSSKVTKKAIQKYIKSLKKKTKEMVNNIFRMALKNPIVLGIIAILLVIFLIFNIILNSIIGIHGSYFIEIDPNQNQWISEINKLNSDSSSKFKQYKNVKIVKNNGSRADWRDVIIAYYMKNNNNISLVGGSTSLGGVTSVDPKTWEKVFKELKSYLNTPYVWGGDNPSTGFDCSGLVQYCYNKFGISLPRVTQDQVKCGTHVEKNALKAGDLVFFAKGSDVHHVGVYIGNGKYLHAPRTGDVVKISELSGRNDFFEGRRVFESKKTGGESNTNTSTNNKILYKALPNHKNYVDLFYKVEKETGVDAILLSSIAMTESSFDPNCISEAGASGLCQMMPETFKELGFDISMIFDPYTNIKACAFEVTSLYKYSCITNVTDMLKAYNAGIGNFMKYSGNIPFTETIQYPGKVLGYYTQFSNGQQPSDIQGNGSVEGVNTQLLQIYNCFIKFHKTEDEKWVLKVYSLEEAFNNLKFTEQEKKEFYNFKEYNGNFQDQKQFGGYDINFEFGF